MVGRDSLHGSIRLLCCGTSPFLFVFLSVSFLFALVSSSFSGVRIYHGYVPGIFSLQVIRDGIPHLVSTLPLRTGTAVHLLFCVCVFFVPSRRL